MKNLILVCSIFLMLFVNHTNAQLYEKWEAIYNYAGFIDDSECIAVDNNGNVYVSGVSSNSVTGKDYATIKYNSTGTTQWVARYSGYGTGDDDVNSIAVDNSGNVYITGRSKGIGNNYDCTTVKYNSSGVQQWVAIYNYNNNDAGNSLALDNSGNIYVTGCSYSSSGTGVDCVTIKYNTSGTKLWEKRYNWSGGSTEYGYYVRTDDFGNIYVSGSLRYGEEKENIFTIKYNSAGTQLWVQRYAGPVNIDHLRDCFVDYSGNVYLTGGSKGNGTNYDILTLKYNSSGNFLWQNRYGSPGEIKDYGNSITVDNTGNVFIGGLINDDFGTIKYSSAGIIQWISKYNGPSGGSDEVYKIALDNNSNVYAMGQSDGIGVCCITTILKYNASGVQQWRFRKSGSEDDYPIDIAVDNNFNVYITGRKNNLYVNSDYFTIKYSQQTRLSKGNGVSEIPDEYSLSQNYPNPFNPVTRISFDLPGESNTLLAVYDALGNQVSILVNEKLQPGTYSADWDASGFSSGVYFYKLITEGYTETRKMILIK